jgi:TPP-dependent indolepyruvate ferredoxin oxidoreductase alpha subunit
MSFHEEPAYAIAHGAALLGSRSCCIIKSHGFLKAANAVNSCTACGNHGGFLVLVAEDYVGSHSDTVLRIAPVIDDMNLLRVDLEPRADLSEVIEGAYRLSEERQLPVFLVYNSAQIGEEIELGELVAPSPNGKAFVRSAPHHLVAPLFTRFQYEVQMAHLKGEDAPQPAPLKSIASGNVELPLPPAALETVDRYRPFFDAFAKVRQPDDFVAGETSMSSLFALPPYEQIDAATFIGGATPLAIGAGLSSGRRTWAISGDFSFLTGARLGILEAQQRGYPLRLIILANTVASATGGQEVPTEWVLRELKGLEQFTAQTGSRSADLEGHLRRMSHSTALSILVVHA